MKKKGQEEIVGFVLIIVIVAIIFLVFLGISVRKGGVDSLESTEAFHFLEASMEFTTNCSIKFNNDFATVSELLSECHDGQNCLDGRDSCELAEKTLEEILQASWIVSGDAPLNGYALTSIFKSESEIEESLVSISQGDCASSSRGATFISPAFPGRIRTSLELCL